MSFSYIQILSATITGPGGRQADWTTDSSVKNINSWIEKEHPGLRMWAWSHKLDEGNNDSVSLQLETPLLKYM